MSFLHATFFIGISFALVAFGQPAWINWLSPLAAAIGFAIFWNAILSVPLKRTHRVCLSVLWYAAVQLIQLSWMTSIEYQGYYILGIYAALSLWLGLQFGFLSFFITSAVPLSFLRIGALAGLWTILEWSRFHTICGFPWNPVGMALGGYSVSMQMAALTGILGLSFWVMLTNLIALKELWEKKNPQRGFVRWSVIAFVPYVFGVAYLAFHVRAEQLMPAQERQQSRVALVQTGLLPSQKVPLAGRVQEFISPWVQWQRIFLFLKESEGNALSMIVLPEYTVPFSARHPLFESESAKRLLERIFGERALAAFPPLEGPFGDLRSDGKGGQAYFVSNAFFSQFLANYFQADVVIGMDDRDLDSNRCYSAGLYFTPGGRTPSRYEKRVLLPMAEYLPFAWCRFFAGSYGITDFYTHGQEAKVFAGRQPFSLSICYEEAFPGIVRDGRLQGAELFINLTNDNWYPNSKLAKQHFDHGRLRAIENGTPLLRACNSGVTAVVNARGQITEQFNREEGVLYADIPTYSFPTLYTKYGDALIVGSSLGFIVAYGLFSRLLNIRRKNRTVP